MSLLKWTNLLTPRLPGAVPTHVRAEVERTIEEFCVRSTAWRETLSGLDVTTGERDVELTAVTDNATAIGVLNAFLYQDILGERAFAIGDDTTNRPNAYTVNQTVPVTITFTRTPEQDILGELDVQVYLKPLSYDEDEDMPSLLENQFFEVIMDGVMSSMLSNPEKPYTNQQLAAFYGKRFLNGITRARVQAQQGFTARAANWVFPRFA